MSQSTLREQLAEAFDRNIDETPEPEVKVEEEKPRDEAGRFTKAAEPELEVSEIATDPELIRPTTWKKEYLPLWEKMAAGETLTPDEARSLAKYSNQRENEYKTGVSTYRTEATAARELQEAIAPFMPALQQHNIQPSTWITNLGQAHTMLAQGSPEQKLQMFAKLAQDYGVPLEAIGQATQGHVDPNTIQMMQYLQGLSENVNSLASWKEQQEMHSIEGEISAFASDTKNFPYFNELKEDMAQLLESGKAGDLKEAYKYALANNDELQERMIQDRIAATKPSVTVAKSKAVSVKSGTPTNATKTSDAKGRRAMLEELVNTNLGSRV